MTGHSPEPWRIDSDDPAGAIEDATRAQCAEAWPGGLPDPGMERQNANARRIVACVNACAGIPTEALEAGALAKAIQALFDSASNDGCFDGPDACLCGAAEILRALGRLPAEGVVDAFDAKGNPLRGVS